MEKKPKSHHPAPSAPKSYDGWIGKMRQFAEKFEQAVNAAAAPLPSSRIKLWLAGFFRPEETYEKAEKSASLIGITTNLLIFYFSYFLLFYLFMLAFTSSLPAKDLAEMGLRQNPDLVQIALVSLLIDPLVSAFLALAQFAVVFAAARALGGTGTYVKQANSMSLVLCGSSALLLAFVCIGFAVFMPSFALRDSAFLGTIVSIITAFVNIPIIILCMAILLYSIYAYYAVVKKAHGLSSRRAAGAIAMAIGFIILMFIVLDAILK
jgi:hypothetical protein